MQFIQNYKWPLLGAIFLHLALLVWLNWRAQVMPSSNDMAAVVNIIQAVAVSEVAKPLETPPPIIQPPPVQVPQAQATEVEAEAVINETPPATEPTVNLARVKALEKKAQQDKAAALHAEKLAQQKAAAAKSRQEAEKAKALKRAQQEAEAKRAAAEKQAAIKKRLAELAKQQQKTAEQLLAKQLIAEEKGLKSAALAQQMQGEMDKYKALIVQAIAQHWIVPDTLQKDIVCKLLIRLAPGGVVLSVGLIQSSGDPALDRSAIAAVHKTSPLPVPSDANLFDKFRELSLTVHPEKQSTEVSVSR